MDLADITDIGIAQIDGSRSAWMHPFQVFGSFKTDLIAQAHRLEIPIQYPFGVVEIDGFGSHLPIFLVGHSCHHAGQTFRFDRQNAVSRREEDATDFVKLDIRVLAGNVVSGVVQKRAQQVHPQRAAIFAHRPSQTDAFLVFDCVFPRFFGGSQDIADVLSKSRTFHESSGDAHRVLFRRQCSRQSRCDRQCFRKVVVSVDACDFFQDIRIDGDIPSSRWNSNGEYFAVKRRGKTQLVKDGSHFTAGNGGPQRTVDFFQSDDHFRILHFHSIDRSRTGNDSASSQLMDQFSRMLSGCADCRYVDAFFETGTGFAAQVELPSCFADQNRIEQSRFQSDSHGFIGDF